MSLGDRIKKYEKIFNQSAVHRSPLIIRVDGRAFHTFTRNAQKPFDKVIMEAMTQAATYVAKDMQGFKVAYIQSDEVTFCLTDYDTIDTQGWFGYELPKIISISAAMMSVAFNKYLPSDSLPVFDSRAFTVPKEDVCNVLVWRAKDWERNSLQMYARAFFSHKQLHNKKRSDMHEMLHAIGKNWATDLSDAEKNGTFLLNTEEGIVRRYDILPTYESIDKATGHYWK